MYTTPTQFAEMQKGQLDAFFALSQTMFAATEKLAGLNLAAAKATVEESVEKAQAMMGVKDIQELMAMTGATAQPAVEKLVSYSRTFYGITNGASAEVSRIVESQIADSNNKVAQAIDYVGKNAPAGTEPVVSFMKSAAAAMNTAYDTFNKAAKQAVDVAEQNIAAATSATMKAASAANDSVKTTKKKAA